MFESDHHKHEQFVSTREGCGQKELFLVQIVIVLGILLRNVAIPWIFLGRRFSHNVLAYWGKFCIDFIFLVVPGFLSVTLFSHSLTVFSVVIVACIMTIALFVACEYHLCPERQSWRLVLNKIIEEHHQPTMFLTYFRSGMLALVATAILAIDFPVFPRRFAKTEQYGHSLMDIGVAAFVYAAAIGSRLTTSSMREEVDEARRRQRFMRIFSSTFILVVIGAARTLALTRLQYPQPVSEYGVHWNFFYTFAVVQVVAKLLPKSVPIVFATVFGICHQYVLSQGYEDWILSGTNDRSNLFSANAEGIVSLMGYLSLYYFSAAIGAHISRTGVRIKSWIECCFRLFLYSAIFFGFQHLSQMAFGLPSRRIINIPYVWSQLSLLTFSLAMCMLVQLFSLIAWAANAPHFSSDENPWQGVEPCLSVSLNRSGLAFFLLSNVFTGMVNLSIDTKSTDDVTALFVIFGYLLLVCILIHYRGYLRINAA